jgi:hypothetical protein
MSMLKEGHEIIKKDIKTNKHIVTAACFDWQIHGLSPE